MFTFGVLVFFFFEEIEKCHVKIVKNHERSHYACLRSLTTSWADGGQLPAPVKGGAPKGGRAQNFALFLPFPITVSLSLCLSGCLVVEFLVVFEAGAMTCSRVEFSGWVQIAFLFKPGATQRVVHSRSFFLRFVSRTSMVRRGWSTVEVPSGWLQVIRGSRPPVARWPGRSAFSANCPDPRPSVPIPDRPRKPNEVRGAASTRVARLQAAMSNLGPDNFEEKKVLDAALRKAQSQAKVPPLEEQIAHTTKFLERAKKRLVADVELQTVKKKVQCEEEVAEAEADLARMRKEVPLPTDHSEDPGAEVLRLRARLAQLEATSCRPVRGSVEAAEGIRTKAAKRRAGCCVADVLPSTEQELCSWLDDKQLELRDAMDMSDVESASAITRLITRGLAKMARITPPLPHCQTWWHDERGGTMWVAWHTSRGGAPS